MEPDRRALEKRAATGRPRDPRIDRAVLEAAAELLVERGYAGTTLGEIARRAGTTTPALYRRWPSKAHLVHEVAIPDRFASLPPSTGDLRADLRALAEGAQAIFGSPVALAAFPGLLADVAHQPDLHDSLLKRFADVFAGLRSRIETAARAGEIRGDVRADRILEAVAGATMMRLMLGAGEGVTDGWVDEVVDLVVDGVRPGVAGPPAPRPDR